MGCAPSIGLHALNMQSNITVFDQWRNAWRNKVVLKSSHGEWPFFHPAYLLGVIITPIYKCPLAPQTKISHPNLAWFQVSWKNRRIMHAHLSNWIIASKKKIEAKIKQKTFYLFQPKNTTRRNADSIDSSNFAQGHPENRRPKFPSCPWI